MAANEREVRPIGILLLITPSDGIILKNDLPKIIHSVLQCEKLFLNREDETEGFVAPYAGLCAHYITANATEISQSKVSTAAQACRLLVRYFLQCLQAPLEQNPLSQIQLITLLQCCCLPGVSLPQSDINVLTSLVKSASVPALFLSCSSDGQGLEDASKEPKRPRLDQSSLMLEQLMTPILDSNAGQKPEGPIETVTRDGDTTISHIPDPGLEVKMILLSKNACSLQVLGGGDILLDVCMTLPYMQQYAQSLEESLHRKNLALPASASEANTIINMFRALLSDVSIVCSALSLPILEPLSPKRLSKVIQLALSCLHACVTVGVACSVQSLGTSSFSKQAPPKEEDSETLATTILQKALETYNRVATTIKASTRAGGHTLQNLHTIGSWLILSGLRFIMTLNPASLTGEKSGKEVVSKGKNTPELTPTKGKDSLLLPRNILKIQQAFGALCVALASQALMMMTSLFEDVRLELGSFQEMADEEGIEEDLEEQILSMTDIMCGHSAWSRVTQLKQMGLTNLLFTLTSCSYRKACMLKKIQKHPVDGDNFSSSDSNTYYEDDFSSSDSSADDDDDSEHILGLWFEETLAPREPSVSSSPPLPQEGTNGKSPPHQVEMKTLIPEKGEPHGYIELATKILSFMNNYFLNSDMKPLKDYLIGSLQEPQMVILAGIIRDLDKESSRSEKGTISIYFGAVLGQLYDDFSGALARFIHNFLATGNTDQLQTLENTLLAQLGISPWTQETWPFQVFSRSLSVLAQILLIRLQSTKKDLHVSSSEKTCVLIWKLFLGTIKALVVADHSGSSLEENEDINVEHAQVLLFLFHNLQLMQKKSILLLTAQTINESVPALQRSMTDMQIIYVSRMLHFFEYMMKNLYDTPSTLIDQIHWNLFGSQMLGTSSEKDNTQNVSKLYFPCRDIEENFAKHASADESHGYEKPKFYYLMPVDINTQDIPKLDGFASSFILSSPETLKYADLYEAILSLITVGKQCEQKANNEKISYLGACAVQYCSSICYRLLLSLPPSVESLEALLSNSNLSTIPSLLQYMIWVPRTSNKVFYGWLKDALVKQGLVTQKAEALLKKVSTNLGNVQFDIKVIKHVFEIYLDKLSSVQSQQGGPPLLDLIIMECLLAKTQVALDDCFSKPTGEASNVEVKQMAEEILPIVLELANKYVTCIRWCLLHQMNESVSGSTPCLAEPGGLPSAQSLEAYSAVLRIASGRSLKLANFTNALSACLPSSLRYVIDQWNAQAAPVLAWKQDCLGDIIPSESFISTVLTSHISSLSTQPNFCVNYSLKRVLQSLIRFAGDLIPHIPDSKMVQDILNVMLPLLLDATMEYLVDYITLAVEGMIGSPESEEFLTHIYGEALKWIHKLLTEHTNKDSNLHEQIFQECLKLMESMLDKPPGKKALEKFFCDNGDTDIIDILLSAANGCLSPAYGTCVLKFFSRLFQQTEKNPSDRSLEKLCSSFNRISKLNKTYSNTLQVWLSKVITGTSPQGEEGNSIQENRLLLQSLTSYIVKENSSVHEEVAHTILSALVPMGSQILSPTSEGIGFSELMVIMANLAGAGSGQGHSQLFRASTEWLELCNSYLSQKDVLEKLEVNIVGGKHQLMMESACYLLSYVADLVGALKTLSERSSQSGSNRPLSPPCDGDLHHPDVDSDWTEDLAPDEEESPGEDSDEDSLCNKLCTFTVTQKEFMNQHWYHCHTCKMVDGVGVCTVCAKVCHKDHDVSYAKYGSFFCDCGAKEDGSCQALRKRTVAEAGVIPGSSHHGVGNSSNSITPFLFPSDIILPSSLRRRPSSPTPMNAGNEGSGKKQGDDSAKHKQALISQLENCSEPLATHLHEANVTGVVLGLLQYLMPAVVNMCRRNSPIGNSTRVLQYLDNLHKGEKVFEHTDQLMVPTLGSQEGAFENVRMNYTGDQGQTIRQLVTAHLIRRVAMCCLATPQGKRQHLAVSHEKGKRLGSAPVPFVVLSITGNPCNEDFLAVCGLRDCHVLTLTSTGSVSDHLVLHPQLESVNYIIKAIWLPGSQTELAIVTVDFVKIYDLSRDTLSPQFFFLLPSGKIRECCFICSEDGQRHMLLMSLAGHIYSQPMVEESSARHGPFYVTNVIDVKHSEVKDTNGTINGGGVSLYYSHSLQLLFFSYSIGKNFIAPFPTVTNEISTLFLIQTKSSNNNNGSSNSNSSGSGSNCNSGGNKPGPQPLCQFSEVPHHPGLILAQLQTSNNPVILMVKPDVIMIQEIKFLSAKSKITDMVPVRHVTSNGEMRTTLILLCEDGSLRIYMASPEHTGFWLSPAYPLSSAAGAVKVSKKKKSAKVGKPAGTVSFPVDFFEHCTALTDIEFVGNDILQIYNAQQVKHRLNTTGMYIASTKPAGFTVEVVNTDNSMVMVGARILVGNQDIQRAPSYIEIFGRTMQVNLTRNRWYDFAFTHEESLTADKSISIFLGVSADQTGITMVDSIKIYGKTKEAFGWPDDSEELLVPPVPAPGSTVNSNCPPAGGPVVCMDPDGVPAAPLPLTPLDRLIGSSLEVLECCFSVLTSSQSEEITTLRGTAVDVATQLLILPIPPGVQQHVKALLATLHTNRTAYNNHKDEALLTYVLQSLSSSREKLYVDFDGEAFYRLVSIARSVAVTRPSNIVKFADTHAANYSSPELVKEGVTSGNTHFITQLTDAFWALHAMRPCNPALAPVSRQGMTHISATVHALVEVIHAFLLADLDTVTLAVRIYVQLLLSQDLSVSFAAKQALIKVLRSRTRRRRVFIPSPPHCSSPGESHHEMETEPRLNVVSLSQASVSSHVHHVHHRQHNLQVGHPHPQESIEESDAHYELVEAMEPVVLLPGEDDDDEEDAGVDNPLSANLGALIAGEGFHLLDIPPDADDETMVELAIALSLQDQPGHPDSLESSQGPQRMSSLEGGHYSDTTASANASDDEGSTAATDGSTLRTSPAEQGGSAGSESGGSGVDSITGEPPVSGRSSMYGDGLAENGGSAGGPRSDGGSSLGAPSISLLPQEGMEHLEGDADTSGRLHTLRLMVLDKLLGYLPRLHQGGGVNAIPYMQVLLMLSSDLNGEEAKDRAHLDSLLTAVISELNMNNKDIGKISERSKKYEVQLIMMRFLSILMSRLKGSSKTSSEYSGFCSTHTASALLSSGALDFCYQTLQVLSCYWRNYRSDDKMASVGNALLKTHPIDPLPDMSPFFLKQYVKGHANDVFEAYPQLMTEMVLRLPYQIKRILSTVPSSSPLVFCQEWFTLLCEYMIMQQTPFVRRQVRKLLLFICGSKDKYRQLRDFHALGTHMKNVKNICQQGGLTEQTTSSANLSLPYDSLISVIEQLKSCVEIATTRTQNWQKFCQKDDTVLPFLIHVSFLLHEGVSSIILQLLQSSLCGSKSSATPQATSSPTKQNRKEREKSEDLEENCKSDDSLCTVLAQQVNKYVDKNLFSCFLQYFLLESNSTAVRWQAHTLILHLYRNSSPMQQDNILDLLWKLWLHLPAYGRKAAQFVDLVGYFTLTSAESDRNKGYIEKALQVLKSQNQLLMNHPNSNIYNSLQGLVEFDGFYLESEPCLVCNNPEVSYSNIKLSAIKVDSRFTTTTQIVKLIGSHSVSKISLRIGDLKRNKMVRTINIYYNNRSVQSVVELKNRPSIWHRAKQCNLIAGQSELIVEFPLPIVACNLMIEYADFYENIQASSETLQCPRCSAAVPANPGVCANCGENVFQCHKCRAINYDEKDPFLCNSCGFCKYAKFDYTLTAKSCCAVDPIENEEDRKKAIASINNLLEKADRVYKQLIANKPALEVLLLRIHEHGMSDHVLEDGTCAGPAGVPAATAVGTGNVNRAIQQLAQRYCSDCKASFDELSKLVQKVLASRKELVEYEHQHQECKGTGSLLTVSPCGPHMKQLLTPQSEDEDATEEDRINESTSVVTESRSLSRCYGCASAAVEQCITLLRAVATNSRYRLILCGKGLIRELVEYNLHRGNVQVRQEVRQLLCLLTRDNPPATADLNGLLMDKIATAVKGHLTSPDLASAVRHEVALLANSLQKEDTCWEHRLRCVMKLILLGVSAKSPIVMESITLPCLKILQILIRPEQFHPQRAPPTGNNNMEKASGETRSASRLSGLQVRVDLQKWLSGEPTHSYQAWKQHLPAQPEEKPQQADSTQPTKEEFRQRYLMEKYGQRWLERTHRGPLQDLKLQQTNWLRCAMFSSSSRASRLVACSIVEALAQCPSRKKAVLDMLTTYLDDLGKIGESAAEFLELYQILIRPTPWKYYLTLRGLLPHLGNLITKEIERLTHLEETTLNSDLSQGYTLKMLTELLASFVEVDNIRQLYKSRLVGFVLNGYLCLRKLVVQRTKLIDETQDKLLELLEDMTTGTESETQAFMSVCVETSKNYSLHDLRTPVFIFERLCSVIYPEENDIGEFFITLEKDPQQEDFLQGRMLGNPYSSTEGGMGPLMRDLKNKICQDCELVALLEDDNGMELLVNNKIISLDLPVKDVFKKIWCSENNEAEAMRVVYRMRGLLGDATEEFIGSLDSKDNEEVDNEELYKMAGVMATCGGLEAMLQRLSAITDLARGRPLLVVLLKLFSFCIKVKSNRRKLAEPSMNAIFVLLKALQLSLTVETLDLIQGPPGGATIPEQILHIMESVLSEASASRSHKEYARFCQTCGTCEDINFLLSSVTSSVVRNTPNIQQLLMRVIPFLTLGNQEKMTALIDHFQPYLNFNKFDFEHTSEDSLHLECFCMLTAGIESNANGSQLKDLMVTTGIVNNSLKYLMLHSPAIKSALWLVGSDDWKEFTSKPALKYVLRILAGLSHQHETTGLLVSADCIPIIHRLEQVSSDERVGSLAENLMEVIKQNPNVAEKIEEVRKQTRDEKKRLAMAMREKQLGALGMCTNEKGQVTARSSLLQKVEELGEESGLVCIICREGYKFQPTKVLGIYTFTKRCLLEECQTRPTKSPPGYSTVTHFNIVHVDCHMAAVRHARGRDEWESAALQNANTKCNGLLPLWGPQVPESAFASCLARHNTYLQESTGHRDISYSSTVHDLKLLLLRFAQERSFSEESGGGGPQSNIHLMPYLIHMALYVINTTRSTAREEKNVTSFLEMQPSRWIENSFETEGPHYYLALCLHIWPCSRWEQHQTTFLRRLLLAAHLRGGQPQPGLTLLFEKDPKPYQAYKPALLYFGLIHGIYNILFKRVVVSNGGEWPTVLAEYVRHSDQALLETGDKLLRFYEDELLPCQSLAEFCDVVGLLSDIPDADAFLANALQNPVAF